MILRMGLVFSLTLAISPAWADEAYLRVQEYLTQDFEAEIKTADFVTPELIEKVKNQASLDLNTTESRKPLRLIPVAGKSLAPGKKHAIHDLQNYVVQRFGAKTVQAASEYKLELASFAGSDQSFKVFLKKKHPGLTAFNAIPSLYQEWGIHKYLIQEGSAKPVLYFKIPASLRYARHYATMITAIVGDTRSRVSFDVNSESQERHEMKTFANSIKKQAGTYDVLSFGYSKVWGEALATNSEWTLVRRQSIASSGSPLTPELLTIKNTVTQSEHKILLISSIKTVWGELASSMISPFLHARLEAVVFMGSSGAVSEKNSVYDLSVPQSFRDQDGRIHIDNMIFTAKHPADVPRVNYGARHGNTFSPIEQDRRYLLTLQKAGFDTIDVEQSLLAREVARYNLKNRTKIQFGAVNLITDKPYNLIAKSHGEFDLDHVDLNQKSNARIRAVQLILTGLHQTMTAGIYCQQVFNK